MDSFLCIGSGTQFLVKSFGQETNPAQKLNPATENKLRSPQSLARADTGMRAMAAALPWEMGHCDVALLVAA